MNEFLETWRALGLDPAPYAIASLFGNNAPWNAVYMQRFCNEYAKHSGTVDHPPLKAVSE